jgi:acid phosphatase type 7
MLPFSRRTFLTALLAGTASDRVFDGDRRTEPRREDEVFQPDTLFLTWQRDPTTTMTVQWIGAAGAAADAAVYSTPLKGGSWHTTGAASRPYPLTDWKVYRAELTGLTPDTDYQFRIGRYWQLYRFRTMPARATDTIHFISGGDCGVNSHTVANNIQAARQDPMFAVVGGDLAYDNGRSAETNLAFVRNYSKHMIGRNGRLIPLVPCIGNHEVDGGYNKPRAKAPFFYALFDGLFSQTSYATLDFGDYLSLVLLDTGHTSPIGGAQADWLERTLRARADHPNVIAVNHVPAYPSFRPMQGPKGQAGTGADNRKYWVPLFQKYRVPVVLEHHDHTFKRTKPLLDGLGHDNGVLYLGDGSWGQIRSPQSPEKLSHLAMSSRDYHLSLHRIEGGNRFHLALDEYGRVMDVCSSGQRTAGLHRVSR